MKSPIRVLFAIGSLGGGGAERVLIDILRRLDRSKFTPLLYVAHRTGALVNQVPEDVPVFAFWDRFATPRVNYPGKIHRQQVRDFCEILSAENVDLVYDRTFFMTLIAGPAATRCGVPRISVIDCEPRRDLNMNAGRFVGIKHALLRRSYRRADRVAAVSDGVRQSAIEYYGLEPKKVVRTYNIIDLARIDRLSNEEGPNWNRERFNIVSAGRLHDQKGYLYLLEAMHRLVNQREHKHIVLHILGEGPKRAELEGFVEAKQLSDHVRFYGFVKNPYPYFRHADLYCLSSLYEGLPTVLAEAMVCRVPVLSTDCPCGPEELIGKTKLGGIVPVADATALAEGIEDAMRNIDQWRPRTEKARAHVERLFSPTVTMNTLEQLFTTVAGKSNPAQSSRVESLIEADRIEKPANIAFALPYGIQIGGTTTWAVDMVTRLHSQGRSAVLLNHSSSNEKTLALEIPTELTVVECGQSGESVVANENEARYESVLPAVFVPSFTAGIYATCAKLSHKHADQMRVLGYCHTYLDYYFNLLVHYEPIIHRFVAVSEECGAKLRELLPHRASDVLMRPYGIQIPQLLNRSYTPEKRPIQLLYAGRIQQRDKRVFDLLKLAEELTRREVSFFMRIVGEGIDKHLLTEKHHELDSEVRSRITIEDSVAPSQMPKLLQSHDVCVMVSEAEGTSVFMLEAMSYGCVPVVTKVSGTEAVVQPGQNGFRHDIGDLKGIAHSIEQLSNDRSLVSKLGQAAHLSSRKYDFDDYVDWFEKLADELWREDPRVWPSTRRLLPAKSIRSRVGDVLPWARLIWRRLQGKEAL